MTDDTSNDDVSRTRVRQRTRSRPAARPGDGDGDTKRPDRPTRGAEHAGRSRQRSRSRHAPGDAGAKASDADAGDGDGVGGPAADASGAESAPAAPADTGRDGNADADVDRDADDDGDRDTDADADRNTDADADPESKSGDGGRQSSSRRRRSRRRSRQRRRAASRSKQAPDTGDGTKGPKDRPADSDDEPRAKGSGGRSPQQRGGGDRKERAGGSGDGKRSSSRRGSGSRRSGGRRTQQGVSEETRRAISEGPPRRMLVTEGEERTEIAVLEERDLVEHYVTRKADVSYVGNVYLGRVQNVLPGMEAAFVDIGKGRNGVLYAREVDYDDTEFDGDETPRIEQTLKPGQTVLVQVTKDPMGTKGARLTQHLSIAGRYCVLAPGDGMVGISRKLPDNERERLRKVLKSVRPDGFGLIVRTAAEGATQEQLEADVSRLTRIWKGVEKRAAEVKPLEAVYEEPSLVIRVIRDIFGAEYTDVVIDSEELAGQVREYLGDVSPELVERVSVHTGEPLFRAYEVTNQVRRALEKKVWLASGGYLIIEKTEAMWVIDVNTGRFVGKSNLEETVLRNNLEAADEIARQLRLRDMGGIIVIDFVDMMIAANRDEVLKRFKRELARDKTKSRVMDISRLGLVQMTRKNVSQGLTETFTTVCDCCEGRGAQILDNVLK